MGEEIFDKGEDGKLDSKTDQYIQELVGEKHSLEEGHPHAARLLQEEINRVYESGRGRPEQRFLDVFHERPTKVVTKVMVPVKEHPRFNFVGKLLGPKGNTLKRLQEETQCRMSVLGRGSMKDRAKEEELRTGLEKKYSHLSDELHVEISALAPPAEAHARVAYALTEVRKYLIPDNNDDIAAQQAREMDVGGYDLDPDGLDNDGDNGYMNTGPAMRPRGGLGGLRGGMRGVSRGSFGSLSAPPPRVPRGGGVGLLRGRGRGGPALSSYERYEKPDTGTGGYAGSNQSYTAPNAGLYEGVHRRPAPPTSQFEDRGRWKQRGGSRFMERSAPYARRT